MTPERLQLWIYKVVPGGRVLALSHDQAIGPALVVASWSREDADQAREARESLAEQLLDAAQDHADSIGEACRFTIQWQTDAPLDGRPPRALRSLIHKAFPQDTPKSEGAIVADAVSTNAMVGQLLAHISTQQKVINGSIGAVLAAYERAMAMQATMLKQAQEQLNQRALEMQHILEARGPETDEQLAEMKRQAWQKVLEVGPDVAKLAIAHWGGGNVSAAELAEATRVLDGAQGVAA